MYEILSVARNVSCYVYSQYLLFELQGEARCSFCFGNFSYSHLVPPVNGEDGVTDERRTMINKTKDLPWVVPEPIGWRSLTCRKHLL